MGIGTSRSREGLGFRVGSDLCLPVIYYESSGKSLNFSEFASSAKWGYNHLPCARTVVRNVCNTLYPAPVVPVKCVHDQSQAVILVILAFQPDSLHVFIVVVF